MEHEHTCVQQWDGQGRILTIWSVPFHFESFEEERQYLVCDWCNQIFSADNGRGTVVHISALDA